jgi:hypothetical protein
MSNETLSAFSVGRSSGIAQRVKDITRLGLRPGLASRRIEEDAVAANVRRD